MDAKIPGRTQVIRQRASVTADEHSAEDETTSGMLRPQPKQFPSLATSGSSSTNETNLSHRRRWRDQRCVGRTKCPTLNASIRYSSHPTRNETNETDNACRVVGDTLGRLSAKVEIRGSSWRGLKPTPNGSRGDLSSVSLQAQRHRHLPRLSASPVAS